MGPLHHFHPNFLTAFLFSCSGIINHQFPDSGHGYNSESDDSFEQEDIEIPPGGLPAQSHTEPQCGATLISERVTRSTPHPSMESQASLPLIAQPHNEVLPENNGAVCFYILMLTAVAAVVCCSNSNTFTVLWNLDTAAERALIQQQFAAITVTASSNQDAVVAAKQNSSRQASNENEHDTPHEQ
ncbi:hypothetical protein RHGRI_029507 [Rhododendron griersonianum]|uniref:Uncharacterized protein n=1 Tax=Rhododendron griersonianum TaxID=479676 RepID=A0AAV6IPD0_9ERIC|nr:hypothetical protein RHGRI_029507 [Rhododendron griersonianum]